ncbi:hypothetical protein Tco_0773826, partial [Tanacetum coccineum]
MDVDFSLVPPHDAEIQEKICDDTDVLLEEEETIELIEEPTEFVSSVKLGRNKDESNLSEENTDQDDHTAFVYEDFDATAFVTPELERKNDETKERKSDETE